VAGALRRRGLHHLGPTLAAPTAELIGDLVARRRKPRFDITVLDLRRFGG
jgi:hypothetical protein